MMCRSDFIRHSFCLLTLCCSCDSTFLRADEVDTSHRLQLSKAEQVELRTSDELNAELIKRHNEGNYAEALKLAQQGLAIRERILGPEHIETSTFINNLAAMLDSTGNYREAEKYYQRAVRIDEKHWGPEHPQTAMRISNLAMTQLKQARYESAINLLQRALTIIEQKLGPRHPNTAQLLHNLAGAFKDQRKLTQAQTLFQRALAIREEVLGAHHEHTASTLGSLAAIKVSLGHYAEAERLFRRAVTIKEKQLGPDHPLTAISVSNLGDLYERQGNNKKAQPLYLRAIQTFEGRLGKEHPMTATALNNLARLYQGQEDAGELERILKRVLAIREKVYGPDHPDVGLTMNDLAILYLKTERNDEAESLLKRILEINKTTLGAEHTQTATVMGNLASAYMDRGKYELAVPLTEQSVAIKKKALSPAHPDIAFSLTRLGMLSEAIGKTEKAAVAFDEARRITASHVSEVLPTLSEDDQAMFIQAKYVNHFYRALSLPLAHADNVDLVNMSAAWLVNGKAVREEALAQRNLLTRDITDGHLSGIVKELLEVRGKLASLAMMAVPLEQQQQRDQVLSQLKAAEQKLAQQLAGSGNGGTERSEWVELDALRKSLPAGAVFVDLIKLPRFDFQATDGEPVWHATHYVAWVTHGLEGSDSVLIDLGPADAVDEQIAAVRLDLQSASKKDGAIAKNGNEEATATAISRLRKLADTIWQPLEPHVGEATQIVLSPDGALWLTPWNALPVGTDARYLVEQCAIRYVVSGRDLLRDQNQRATTAPAVLANPFFDQERSEKASSIQAMFKDLPPTDDLTTRGFEAREVLPRVSALPNTGIEALAILPHIESYSGQKPTLYKERYALERVAKAFENPQLVSFATHGFFLPTQEGKLEEETLTSKETRSAAFDNDGKRMENPLLRCGLLLAGCNNRDASVGDDDGILTGMEIVGIDLRGTKLVVLSACETGLGDIRNGEGVAGLRQAFQLAGAEAVVSTLWQVPDRDSALLMKSFFEELAHGATKAEALRTAQIERIEKRRQRYGAAHPFFWAAFTLTGK